MVNYTFPVVSSGEIDGTVWAKQSGQKDLVPFSRITVQLVDAAENVIREERAARDGFYLMDFIKPGKYTLRLSIDDLEKFGVTVDGEHAIEITGEGTVLNAQDFTVTPIEKPDEAGGKPPVERPIQAPNNRIIFQ